MADPFSRIPVGQVVMMGSRVAQVPYMPSVDHKMTKLSFPGLGNFLEPTLEIG